jgi:hypothetical protein
MTSRKFRYTYMAHLYFYLALLLWKASLLGMYVELFPDYILILSIYFEVHQVRYGI